MRTNRHLAQEALSFFEAGVRAVDPYRAVASRVRVDGDRVVVSGDDKEPIEIGPGRPIVVVGAGKATARMCQAIEDTLGDRIAGGVVVVKHGHTAPLARVETVEASHPVPDEDGVRGVDRMLALLDDLRDDAVVLALISGGGSALLPGPAEGIRLSDKQAVTDLLLAAGADIREMNTVRKHISAVKGGQLTRRAHPARVITFVLSDVVGDPLDAIASGPTVPDTSTFADALAVLDKYSLEDRVPASVLERLAAGARGEIAENPKPGDPAFDGSTCLLVGTNRRALDACCEAARQAGWNTMLLSSLIEGETRDVARMHTAIAREIRKTGTPLAPPACVVSGGETTVTLREQGRGGRNQEFALAAALDIAGEQGVAVLSAGTDGNDGPTDAAGAIAFGDTVQRGRQAGLEAAAHLAGNDAYPFFERIGDLIKTGPTNTNVMDVHILLIDSLEEAP